MRHLLLGSGLTLLSIAGLFHLYVFYLESVAWTRPKTWKTFKVPSQEHAEIIRPMALNQGFYNLILGVGILIGLALVNSHSTIAYTLLISSATSMVGAGVVLMASVKGSGRAAAMQALPPFLGVVILLLGFNQ
jgi:putative membrane protein